MIIPSQVYALQFLLLSGILCFIFRFSNDFRRSVLSHLSVPPNISMFDFVCETSASKIQKIMITFLSFCKLPCLSLQDYFFSTA